MGTFSRETRGLLGFEVIGVAAVLATGGLLRSLPSSHPVLSVLAMTPVFLFLLWVMQGRFWRCLLCAVMGGALLIGWVGLPELAYTALGLVTLSVVFLRESGRSR